MSDLISRSAVMDVLRECNLDEQLFEKDVFDKLKALPTIEAVPVVHGEWIKEMSIFFPTYKCSECQEKVGALWYKYCPNCGVKMKGGE